ncbi:MAG: acetate--CoA ligase family protein [Sterolibacteriaceae bacterium]|nr:acetate--CoA ligase family protein [Sterolibacteriaceae bacterium]
MTVRNLEFLFHPRSVAVVAETDEQGCYADVVLRNLQAGGFAGPILAATAKKRSLFGIGARMHIDELDPVPDLAIVCAPLCDVAQIVAQLGSRGTKAVIVGPSLHERMTAGQVQAAHTAILEAARPYLMRVLGPGSGGIAVPALGLAASVAPVGVAAGKIGLVTQSAAVAAAVLDRAHSKGIGFSTALHLGVGIDVDLADAIDWLANDPDTEAILVQFDTVAAGRKFMSAARAAARNRPIVVIRGKRVAAPASATAPFSTDDVYAAALRRAGWVRIDTLEDMFDAAEAMARVRPMAGERLCIMGNGRGMGRIAAEALLAAGGRLASLEASTVKQLGELLRTEGVGNPLALPANIAPAAWAAALELVLADRNTDAVLTVCSPSPFAPGSAVAEAICDVAQKATRNVFTCWVGGSSMQAAQRIAAEHGVLSQDSPEKAIAIFVGIVNYERNRQLLVEMPPSQAEDFSPDLDRARDAVAEAIAAGVEVLTSRQARQLLQAYGIDAAERPLAGSIDEAIRAADEIGYPVDLGLVLANAPDYCSMARSLRSPEEIRLAVRGLRNRLRNQRPGSRVSGYRLRPGAARSGIAALRLGVGSDPVFGPVIFIAPAAAENGHDGDYAVALPPLNRALAQDLVARCGFAREAPEDERDALEAALGTALVRLSQMLTDIDEIAGIELDPMHVEATGAVTHEARIRIEKRGRKLGYRRFAIRPYPRELEQRVDWQGRQLLIRPIRPEDETTLGDLIASLDPEDSRMRFFGTMRRLPRSKLARFTQIDYDREMALVAIERDARGTERSLGEVRAMADPDNAFAEFAIVVSSQVKGLGLGRLLLQRIIDYCRNRGTGELRGETLAGNLRMQHLARDLGFELKTGADPGTIDLRLPLRAPTAAN